MSEDAWYRNSNWSKKEQEYFWDKINKSRSSYNKAQYARIKALYLFESKKENNILSAIQILKIMLEKWPEESELAFAYLQLAEAYSEINEQENAIFNFEKCLSSEKKYPGYRTMVKTLYPKYIVENNLNNLYKRALALVKEEEKEELLLPNQLFIISAVNEILGDAPQMKRD